MRVLLVVDEPDLAKLIARNVSARGFVVDQVGCVADALEAVDLAEYALVLLDRRLPDGDGIDAIPAMRAVRPAVPVIVLTALDAVAARIEGLDAGADDYLTKPFSLDELLARIRAALRRPGDLAAAPPCTCGNVTFDPASRTVLIGREPIVLTRRELMLLETLILRAGRVVQRAALAGSLYGFDDMQDNALDASVARLRRRLEAAASTARIHTVRGLGYMLRAEAG